jgi:hypothetical protein
MANKVCLDCPNIGPWKRGRCTTCERVKDQARGTRAERGYDAAHIRESNQWRAKVRAGELVTCWRCGQPITDPTDLHLGHDDHDRSITRGPEHGRACNLRAAAQARHGIPPRD